MIRKQMNRNRGIQVLQDKGNGRLHVFGRVVKPRDHGDPDRKFNTEFTMDPLEVLEDKRVRDTRDLPVLYRIHML